MRIPPVQPLFDASAVAPIVSPPQSRRDLDQLEHTRRPAPPVAARLAAAWSQGRLAAVADRELTPAIDTLMTYHAGNGYFGNRLDGMRRLNDYGSAGEFEVALAPNRTKVPFMRKDGQGPCGLCDPPLPLQRGLTWRDYKIWPNAYPYVPAEEQHLLITSGTHQPQGFSRALLDDLLDFQLAAHGGRQLTLFYNGVAGNSQYHLHWQATRVSLPLERRLDDGRLTTQPLLRTDEGRLETYDQGAFAGFLVTGSKSFVGRWGQELVERLNQDPLTRGAYNLLLLQPKNGELRLVVVPRRVACLKPEIGSLGARSLGAFNVAGIMVLPQRDIPADFSASISEAIRATTVPPAELGWTAALSRSPRRKPLHPSTW